MGSRSGLRNVGPGRLSSRINHDQELEPESSDEDDDGIPASKLSIVSPAKRPATCLSRPAKRSKRLASGPEDGIVLWPPLQRQKNVLNVTPVPRAPLPSTNMILPSPAMVVTSPLPYSPSPTPEDEVPEGLVREVNDALRQLQRRESKDHSKRQTQDMEVPSYHSTPKRNGTKQDEDHGSHDNLGSNYFDLSGSISPTLPLDHPPHNTQDDDYRVIAESALNGGASNTEKDGKNHTHGPETEPGANEGNEVREEAPVPAELASKNVHDVWEVQSSPEPQADHRRHRPSRDPRLEGPEERNGTAKSLSSVNSKLVPRGGSQIVAKRKRGRPRKNYHHLLGGLGTDIAETRNPTDSLTGQEPQPYRESIIGQANSPIDGVNGRTKGDFDGSPVCLLPDEPSVSQEQAHDVLSNNEDAVDFDDQVNTLANGSCTRLEDKPDVLRKSVESDHDRQVRSAEPSGPSNIILDEDDEADSDFIDESEADYSGDENDEIRVEDRFARDVHHFTSRGPFQPHEDDVFRGPPDDDATTVHVDPAPLKQLCRLLVDESWTGTDSGQPRRTARTEVETKPGRAFLRVLGQLDRLFRATPKAPELRAQNTFLKEHANMLSYYFHKTRLVLEHIRTQRLEVLKRNYTVANTGAHKRRKMVRDLVVHVIPKLARLLATAWALGGEGRPNGSFTCAVVELVERGLGWMMSLHGQVFRELRRWSLEESTYDYQNDEAWQAWDDKKEEISQAMNDLRRVIDSVPDLLAAEEARNQKELQRLRQQAERRNQLKAQQQLAEAEKARLASTTEREKPSLRSVHGAHHPLESSAGFSGSSRSLTPKPVDWSLEEKTFLFKKIQEAFPGPPDIGRLRWDLNRTYAETTAVAEEILEKMLATVKPNQPVDERVAEVRRIMRGRLGS